MKRGRPRKLENAHLPAYVYRTRRGYVWKEYDGARFIREVLLAPLTAPLSEVWERWEHYNIGPKSSLLWLAGKYLKSEQHKAKSEKTRKEYESAHETIMNTPTRTGVFGDTSIKVITPGVIRKYMDKRAEVAPVSANREVAYLSVVFSWGYERDLCLMNPCKGIRKQTEEARTRYVNDAEYGAVYGVASNMIKAAMEIAYLCRLRKAEVLNLTRRDISDQGLTVHRLKGSKDSLVAWSPRLKAAVNLALSVNQKSRVQSEYLFRNRRGQRITDGGFHTLWQRLRAKQGIDWTFHDLKAKGISDVVGDKQKASGHKSPAMVERYDRKMAEVEATR